MILLSLFGLWFLVISFLTFTIWLEPIGLKSIWNHKYQQPWIAALFTLVFFLNCFIVGVMLSIYQLEGRLL